jgi:lauroyl/myristoyl acyltransferase
VLFFVLYPYSFARSLPKALAVADFPARHFPPRPRDHKPGLLMRWRFQAATSQRWLPLFWADVWAGKRWENRLTSDGDALIDELHTRKPIVVLTVHTRSHVFLGPWLMAKGLGIGSVVIDREAWLKPENVKARSDPRWEKYTANNGAFLAGDTRQMIRYLQPGRVLALPADHQLGRTAEGNWPGGRLRLAVGGLRIARMTGAAVVPMIVTDEGRWRFHVHVGKPLDEQMLATGDDEAAVCAIARELMPSVVGRPFEALRTLVEATSAEN